MNADDNDVMDFTESQLLLRRGKWSSEEENYANKIISLFNQGKLSILPGTTLRSYLSEKLQCDPMRITKKYAGKSCIGKQIYQPCEGFQDNAESIREAEAELELYEKIFLNKIQAKAAASMNMHSPANQARSPSQRILMKQSMPTDSSVTILATNHIRLGNAEGDEGDSADIMEEEDAGIMEEMNETATNALAIENQNPKDFVAYYPHLMDKTFRKTASPKNANGRPPLSAKKANFYRRNMSAPNLTTYEELPSRASSFTFNNPLQSIKEEHEGEYNNKQKITDEFLLLGGRVHLPNFGEGLNYSSNSTQISSFSAKKRSHSVMALMDFEKLVNDDKAAGDLFYEFITTIGGINSSSKKISRGSGGNSANSHKLSRTSETSEIILTGQPSFQAAIIPMKMEEEESSNHSHDTVVHKYQQDDGGEENRLRPFSESIIVLKAHENDLLKSSGNIVNNSEGSVLIVQQPAQLLHAQASSLASHDDSTDECENFF